MLIDQATIYVRGGKGGDGALSFRREKFIPKGGPDGGDGGDGGDVVFLGDSHSATLLSLARNPHLRATHGQQGMGKSMHGADGEDFVAKVPLGTLVYDAETGKRIADVNEHGQRVIVARGGCGGLGNEHFKSATNQTPREFTLGKPGEERTLRLELKLIADVGLIGMPNAGKSTMLRAISRATPKVAEYPFTTLSPYLGIADLPGDRRLVFADIPGLIEGAAGGAGLGHDFLRHIERTSVLVHVLDVAPIDGSDPAANYETIRREIFEYSPELAEKKEIIALNKVDLLPGDEATREKCIRIITNRLGLPPDEQPVITSGATSDGVRELLEACWAAAKSEQPGDRATWPEASRRSSSS